MRTENGQIKDILDGSDMGDGASVAQSSTIYDNGPLAIRKPPYVHKVNTNGSGQSVFHLTADGTSSGAALFTTIKHVSIEIHVNSVSYHKAYAMSNGGKTLTVSVTQQTFNTQNVLLTLLGALVGAVTSVTYPAAGSGIEVEIHVIGI